MIDDQNIQRFWESLGTGGKALSIEEIKKRALERPIDNDVYYLAEQWPYLDICNADVSAVPELNLPYQEIIASSQWIIQDRGERLIAGCGRLRYGAYQTESMDGTENAKQVTAVGTLVKQMHDTTVDMIKMAKARSWPAIQILEGSRTMQRIAWMCAEELKISTNYGPTFEDIEALKKMKEIGLNITTIPSLTLKSTPTK